MPTEMVGSQTQELMRMRPMPKRTKQAHRGRVTTDAPPPANEWVYACSRGLPTPAIVAALRVGGQPVTEVAAHTWQHDW